MKRNCPNFSCSQPDQIIKDGSFRRKDDSRFIQRFRCKSCGTRFSSATFADSYRQKRRRINVPLIKLFSSGVSQRRAAILLGVHRTTIERRLGFLATRCRKKTKKELERFHGKVFNLQIDDLITKEKSKLMPLSVSIVVDEDRRLILGTEVSKIPAFGHLSRIAIKKYGPRSDEHNQGLERLFGSIKLYAYPEAIIKSDEHQRYPSYVSATLPRAKHLTFKSERGCIAGQGELKKVHFDPLFIINHTCALLRANINRLIRKTWCTTKNPDRLKDHLDIFTYFYNELLLRNILLTPL